MISKLHDLIARAGVAALFIILAFLPIFSHAGGLGIAPLGFTAGCFGILLLATRPKLSAPPLWFWALILFLIWAAITSFWSPYDSRRALANALVLLIMVPVTCAAVPLFKKATKTDVNLFRHLLMATTVMAIGLLVIDLLSGYGLNLLFDPLNEGQHMIFRQSDAEMNLGHSITVQALLLAPVLVLMWTRLRGGKVGAGLLIAGLIWAGVLCRLSIAHVAIASILFAMGAARLSADKAIMALFILAFALIFGAPLIGYFSSLATDEFLLNLPLSWEHRVRMWAYSWERITEAPIFGHGFDAVRTYDETFTGRDGRAITIVSLHPHNVGLHIWTETGAIGAGLASLVLLGLYQPARAFARHKHRAIALAGLMAAIIVISILTYGVWQYWWWGIIFLAVGTLHFVPKETIIFDE